MNRRFQAGIGRRGKQDAVLRTGAGWRVSSPRPGLNIFQKADSNPRPRKGISLQQVFNKLPVGR